MGNGAFSRQLKKSLQQNGVDISGVRTRLNELSGTCAVFVEQFTGESGDTGYPGANTNWVPRNPDSVECLAGGQVPDLVITHLENKRETIERVLETASEEGVDTLLNLSPTTYLSSSIYKNVTHLLINERGAAELTGRSEQELMTLEAWQEAAKYFMENGVENVVITLGAKGVYYASKGEDGLVPAVKDVKVKDTTGAG